MPTALSHDSEEPFSTQASFEDTLTAVCEAAVKLVGVQHSGLVLFSRDYEYGTVMAEYPSQLTTVVDQKFPIAGVPLEEELVHLRRPIVVREIANEGRLGVVQKVLLDMGVRSIVVVPIIVDNEVKGSFSFDSIDEIREFTESDVEKCAALAKFASVTIKNAYLLRNLDALRKAMLAIASEPNRVQLLRAITQQAVNLIQAKGGGIDELDERKQELAIVAQINMPDEIVGETMKVGEGLAGLIIKNNLDDLAVPDYSAWENRAPYFKDTKILESLIGVRLRLKDKSTGVLWLSGDKHRIFTPAEVELLQGLAAPASIALEQTELRERERYRATQLQELANVTNKIFRRIATSDRKERLELVAEYAHEIVDAETCAIFLVSQPGWLKLVASHGHREGYGNEGQVLQINSGDGTGLIGHIASTGAVFSECGEKLTSHPAVKNKISGGSYSRFGACYSLLAIPLKGEDGELRGLLSISNKSDKDGEPNEWTCFTLDDRSIGEVFAQAAMVAIETADLQDRYKTLLEVSNLLTLSKVPENGLGAFAKVVLAEINKSFCRILFYHEADQTIQVVAAEKATGKKGAFTWQQRLGEKSKVSQWKGLGQSLETGEFVVQKRGDGFSDANLDELSRLVELRDEVGQPLRINYLLRSPLKVNERIIGLLLIGETDQQADFSQFELDLAQILSSQASRLIERLQWNKKLLLNLFETERQIGASTEANVALKWVAEEVYDVGRAYGRKVNVVDINVRHDNTGRVVAAYPEGQLEHIRGIVGDPFDLTAGIGDSQQLGLVGRVLISGRPIWETHVQNNPDYIPIHKDTLSQLVVPIKEGDEVVGAISVESSEASAFDEWDLMLVEGIAIQASSAISREKHSREYKKVRTVALAGAAAQLWRHGLKDKARRIIERVDEARVRHSSIEDVLAHIRRDAQYIEDFRFIPLSSEDGVADEVLNNVLHNYLEDFHDSKGLQGLEFTMRLKLEKTREVRVRINRDWFQKAISFFLENASAAISLAGEKFIEVETLRLEDSRFQILIKNSGAKIPDDVWDKMGNEQIVKGDGNIEKGGGLLLADLILVVYGGKLEKVNNQDNNIVLGMTLPMVL